MLLWSQTQYHLSQHFMVILFKKDGLLDVFYKVVAKTSVQQSGANYSTTELVIWLYGNGFREQAIK